jgi:hypothetical protein
MVEVNDPGGSKQKIEKKGEFEPLGSLCEYRGSTTVTPFRHDFYFLKKKFELCFILLPYKLFVK